MANTITRTLKAGYFYTVTATTTCTVSTADGIIITTVEPGAQGSFVAPVDEVVFSDPDALVTQSFKGASAAVSGGGGGMTVDLAYSGTSPHAQSGLAVAEAVGRVDTYVQDFGQLEADLDLRSYRIDSSGRSAATDEIWLEFGDNVYQVLWPYWLWLEGEEPTFSTNRAYCICVRLERASRIIANLAYEYITQ